MCKYCLDHNLYPYNFRKKKNCLNLTIREPETVDFYGTPCIKHVLICYFEVTWDYSEVEERFVF